MANVTSYNSSYTEIFDGDVPQDRSNSIRLYNYGFSIANNTINGIIVNIYCSSSRLDTMTIQLYDGTTLIGASKSGFWNTNQVFGTS